MWIFRSYVSYRIFIFHLKMRYYDIHDAKNIEYIYLTSGKSLNKFFISLNLTVLHSYTSNHYFSKIIPNKYLSLQKKTRLLRMKFKLLVWITLFPENLLLKAFYKKVFVKFQNIFLEIKEKAFFLLFNDKIMFELQSLFPLLNLSITWIFRLVHNKAFRIKYFCVNIMQEKN